jgi:N6-adenosine-specific RNA methylase IME4
VRIGKVAERRGQSISAIQWQRTAETMMSLASKDLLELTDGRSFKTILADPPWQFQNKTGKVAPEHRRLNRYGTMELPAIKDLPVRQVAADTAHLYLCVPNALLPEGLEVMEAWGFKYKSNLIWHKVRKDGGSDGRGVGFYFRNVTEIVLFGVRGKNARTLAPGRRQVNLLATRKREHRRTRPTRQRGRHTCIIRCARKRSMRVE